MFRLTSFPNLTGECLDLGVGDSGGAVYSVDKVSREEAVCLSLWACCFLTKALLSKADTCKTNKELHLALCTLYAYIHTHKTNQKVT